MSLHHGLTDLRNDHFTDSYILLMVPNILPSQLDILSIGQTISNPTRSHETPTFSSLELH